MLWYLVGMSFMINIGPESREDVLFEIFLSGKTDRQVLHTKKWLFSTFNKWSLWIYSTAVLNPLVHPSDQIYNRWKTARRTRALAVQENGEQTSHNTRKLRPNLGSADQVCLIVFRHPFKTSAFYEQLQQYHIDIWALYLEGFGALNFGALIVELPNVPLPRSQINCVHVFQEFQKTHWQTYQDLRTNKPFKVLSKELVCCFSCFSKVWDCQMLSSLMSAASVK
jgi:hypothetical protein